MTGTQPHPLRHCGRLNRRGRKARKMVGRQLDLIEALLGRVSLYPMLRLELPYRPMMPSDSVSMPAFGVADWPLIPEPRLPTTRICGVDVAINRWLPKDWFGRVGRHLVAESVSAAEAVLSHIVWTDPPCWMKSDGTIVEIPRAAGGR